MNQKRMEITALGLLMLVDRRIFGTPAGPGWGLFPTLKCEKCGEEWDPVEKLGTKVKFCPCCGFTDPEWMWIIDSPIHGEGSDLWPVGWEIICFLKFREGK